VDRAVKRLYERIGAKVVLVGIAGSIVLSLITAVVVLAVAFRYLRLSTAQAVSAFELWMPILLGLVAVGMWTIRGDIREALGWSSGGQGGTAGAVRVWHIGSRIPHFAARVALFSCVGMAVVPFWVILHYHRPWYDLFPLLVGGIASISGLWVLVVFGHEVLVAPMIRDAASRLPPDFEPRARGMQLRTRALTPLPIVTFFAAMTVGAYADISTRSDVRLTFAAGICLATVAVATVIFLVVNRSVLAPIDDLIAATERVRAGDISTPVPVVTADELGRLAGSFNDMLADLRDRTEELRASRERIVASAAEERRRVERDLHDGAQQQLVLAQLKAARLERLVEGELEAAALAAELRADLGLALAELRDLARGLYPPRLETEGLAGALSEAASRASISTAVECDGAGRYRPELEAAVYFCCLEALQNAAKHAGEGASASVRLASADGTLTFEISDDGRGFDCAEAPSGTGLRNMADRIGALGGDLQIRSRPGQGTKIRATVPNARARSG
jgi:signal transduction histidine kinase